MEPTKGSKGRRRTGQKLIVIIIAVIVFLLALGVTLYPIVSVRYNEKHQSQVLTQYQQQLDEVDNSQFLEERARAEVYNRLLRSGTVSADIYGDEALIAAAQDYNSLLNLAGNGMMGYLEIPVIGVKLPIYHGTEGNTLEIGVGHLLGSSLPIGGEGCHAVLSAHSGMAGQKMFSDLPQLEAGDKFYLTVLDEVMAYEVDQIAIVIPSETELLGIYPDEDLCTLFTCYPFGINSHRLLVRGTRIPYEVTEKGEPIEVEVEREAGSTWEEAYLKSIFVGIGCAVALFIIVGIVAAVRKRVKRRA